MRIGVLTLATCLAVCSATGHASESSCTVSDKPADLSFSLLGYRGNNYHLRDHAGEVIVLDFWATWCAPCRIEIPGFVKLQDQYESQGLTIIGISIDDPPDAISRFAEAFNMDYPVVVGDGRDDVKAAFGPLVGFPTTIIIDRDGNICHHHTGFTSLGQLDAEIQALLGDA